jgi:hypothetical protein
MINKIFLIFCVCLIYLATLLPGTIIHYSTYGKVTKTQIIEKVEEVPVKRVTINIDNVSSTVNTKKPFRRFRLIVYYEYKCNKTNKTYNGIHKFGEYPQYLTELELVNIKRKYYKGATVPIYVNRVNKDNSTLISPTNYQRIILSSIGLSLILYHIYLVLTKIRDAKFSFEDRKLAPILRF